MYDPNGTKQSFLDFVNDNTVHLEVGNYLIEQMKLSEKGTTINVWDTSKKDKETGEYKLIGLVDTGLEMIFTAKRTRDWNDINEFKTIEKWKKAIEKKIKSEVDWSVFSV